jgi:hypothetical protein
VDAELSRYERPAPAIRPTGEKILELAKNAHFLYSRNLLLNGGDCSIRYSRTTPSIAEVSVRLTLGRLTFCHKVAKQEIGGVDGTRTLKG